MKIEFFKHNITPEDVKNIKKVLRSTFLTTGKTVEEFEKRFAKYLGVNYAIGLTSCTAALQLSLEAYGIGRGDEVITTPLSFVATSNAILQTGAKPVFVDVEKETGNIDVNVIEKAITKKSKAIIPVHLYGQMCDMKKMRKIADKYNLKIIEDAAHCIEGERDGIRPGQLGDVACFSFYATKSITCGEGGATITNDKDLAEKLQKMRLHGLTKSASERYEKKFQYWDMEMFGWKYNMDNIQAALLLNQLNQIDKYWQRRKKIADKYEAEFKKIRGINFPKIINNSKHAKHLFTIWVDPKKRERIVDKLSQLGIPTTINYRPIHLLSFYKRKFGYKEGDFPNVEKIGATTLSLPFYPKLQNSEVNYIIKSIKRIYGYSEQI